MLRSILPVAYQSGQTTYEIHNAKERPELWDILKDPFNPLHTAWPVFLDQDTTYQTYYPKLVEHEELARYQFVITETYHAKISIVACAKSVPFFWPEIHGCNGDGELDDDVLKSLPDGGYDTILSRGVRQYFCRKSISGASVALTKDQEHDTAVCNRRDNPNGLSAISITVQPDRRRQGLAEALIKTMKETAIAEGLKVLVVPLRPTMKATFPLVSMKEYITWPHIGPTVSSGIEYDWSKPTSNARTNQFHNKYFDPWLRKHISLGGKIVKVAPYSMVVDRGVSDWREWTGTDLQQVNAAVDSRKFKKGQTKQGLYLETTFPGGLVPLRFSVQEGRGVYIEPNIWVYHGLQNGQRMNSTCS